MGDNNQATFSNDPAAHAPDAAAYGKGKGKAVEDPMDVSMDEDDESDESDAEEPVSYQIQVLHKTATNAFFSRLRWPKVNYTFELNL